MMRTSAFPGFSNKKPQTNKPPKKRLVIENDGLSLLENLDDTYDAYGNEYDDVVESITAPLISHDAAVEAEEGSLSQYGVFGQVLRTHAKGFPYQPEDRRLYCNINAPFTAVVCGVQGSGKSHTVSVLLETMLIQDRRLGLLPSALSALVLHFGESGSSLKPCEATFVGHSADAMVTLPEVVVFCSPSNYTHVSRSYAQFGGGTKVYPLYFQEEDLDATSLLALMAVSDSGQMPLYMHMVMQVISELGEAYSYTNFKMRLGGLMLEPIQARMLDQRLSLLEGFLCRKQGDKLFAIKQPRPVPVDRDGTAIPAPPIRQPPGGRFKQGQLTIVDLTDPFVSPSAACSLFEIVLKLYNKAELKCSKVVVLDEAHKYLSAEGGTTSDCSKRLTERLLSFTRQQRHLAMRVIISTQEPTVCPSNLLDLCSFIVCHRFFSAGWFGHLAKHVSSELDSDAFERVVMLDRGECLIFSPTALFIKADEEEPDVGGDSWAKPAVAGWGATEFTPSTVGSGWGSETKASNAASGWGTEVKESKANNAESGWGDGADKTGTEGKESGWAAIPSADDKWDDEKAVGPVDTGSVASDDIDIIIKENVFQPQVSAEYAITDLKDDTLKLRVNAPSPKPDLSGWDIPAPVPNKSAPAQKEVGQLGRGYIVVKTRKRITDDGGKSILATDQL